MRDVFFIQRAAIDILLLNQATAIEICTYLVISKYADRNGYYSGVGYKTIKERLGIGQKKAEEAIKRLTAMHFEGQNLLYSADDWLSIEAGEFQDSEETKSRHTGWVRGYINSGYQHQVWLSNDLIGNNGDINRPLNYFVTIPRTDNHSRMLLLLFKYNNRQYSGVNYKLASRRVTTEEQAHQINGYEFHKSHLEKSYHISTHIFRLLKISLTEAEATSILDDLFDSRFINISISAIGNYQTIKRKYEYKNKLHRFRSDKQIAAYELYQKRLEAREAKRKLNEEHISYKLVKRNHPDKENKAIVIKRITINTKEVINDIATKTHDALLDPYNMESISGDSITTPSTYTKFVYRLDYKSANKRVLKLDSCLANRIEDLATTNGLSPVSRNRKFHKSYWWLNPGITEINLVGILTPSHLPTKKLPAIHQVKDAINKMTPGKLEKEVHQKVKEPDYTIPDGDF